MGSGCSLTDWCVRVCVGVCVGGCVCLWAHRRHLPEPRLEVLTQTAITIVVGAPFLCQVQNAVFCGRPAHSLIFPLHNPHAKGEAIAPLYR